MMSRAELPGRRERPSSDGVVKSTPHSTVSYSMPTVSVILWHSELYNKLNTNEILGHGHFQVHLVVVCLCYNIDVRRL